MRGLTREASIVKREEPEPAKRVAPNEATVRVRGRPGMGRGESTKDEREWEKSRQGRGSRECGFRIAAGGTDHESRTTQKRNGQTNPPRRNPKAAIETGWVLPHVADGSARLGKCGMRISDCGMGAAAAVDHAPLSIDCLLPAAYYLLPTTYCLTRRSRSGL